MIIAGLGVAMILALFGVLKSCEDRAVVVGGELQLIATCSDQAPADLLPLLLLVIPFIWADVSEIDVLGSGLKKRTEQIEREQQELRLVVMTSIDWGEVRASVESKERAFRKPPDHESG